MPDEVFTIAKICPFPEPSVSTVVSGGKFSTEPSTGKVTVGAFVDRMPLTITPTITRKPKIKTISNVVTKRRRNFRFGGSVIVSFTEVF